MLLMIHKINETVNFLKNKVDQKPQLSIILGSGLGEFANYLDKRVSIPYSEIPWFPQSTVKGHAGRLVFGELSGLSVLAMQGRFHYYEGYSMHQVTFPIRVMAKLGVNKLIVTNSAGGVNRFFEPGELMIITDHLNLIGTNPLIGIEDETFGPRFVDLSNAYDPEMIELCEKVGLENGIMLRKGVYAGLSGPSYETPAEIRMLERLGADAVGMSTVPEVIVARQHGLQVLGISCITNMAAGHQTGGLDHKEVVAVGNLVSEKFSALIRGVISEVSNNESL
jgi:purine-nucleoside phosphorylase